MTLRLGWCTHEAAKYACRYWHYSHSIPAGKLVKIGVWEFEEFIGCIIYSRGASPYLLDRFEISQTEGCELTRVALKPHATPVSRMLSISFKFLKKHCPGLRLVVSFADPEEGHVGGIYKATNWVYTGQSNSTVENYVDGRWQHVRNSYHKIKGKAVQTRIRVGKHRYVMPLDDFAKTIVEPLRLPYPENLRARSTDSGAPDDQSGGGGAVPTRALIDNALTAEELCHQTQKT